MTLNQAIETAKAKAANHPEWLRAIDKAARLLASGELCVTLFADNTALVTSPNGSYRVNGHCPCAAKTAHCYHRAAKRLVEMAEPVATKAATRDELIADIKATFAAKFPGYRLADTVQRLCGPYAIENLGVAPLNHILAAIA